jgi:hypothetical protein
MRTDKNRKKINCTAFLLFLPLVIAVLFFALHPHGTLAAGTYENQENIPGASAKATDFITYMKQVIGFGYAVIGILAMFMLCIGAYQYLMAAGNLAKAESAKNTISSALLGLVLGVMSWVILYTINPDLVDLKGLTLTTLTFTSTGTTTTSSGSSGFTASTTAIALNGTVEERVNSYSDIIKEASQKYGVPENIIKAMIDAESSGNPYAVSPKGATGLMQLMPGTAAGLGVTDSRDPYQNIMGGTKYISQMYNSYGSGSWENALWAYNAGPGNMQKGVFPDETKNYINTVLGKAASYGTTDSLKVM